MLRLRSRAVRQPLGLVGIVHRVLRQAVLRRAHTPTENIRLSQNNIVEPENHYQQTLRIQVELPADIFDKDLQGTPRLIERCAVRNVVPEGPEFVIEGRKNLDAMRSRCRRSSPGI